MGNGIVAGERGKREKKGKGPKGREDFTFDMNGIRIDKYVIYVFV